MSRVFFTADHHFHHKNIIQFCNRPFSSVEEMNREMIGNWNDTVGHKDIVYHLGDFCFGNKAEEVFSQLNGKVFVVPGNHDAWMKGYDSGYPFRTNSGSPVEILPSIYLLKGYETPIVLCHYPLRSWQGSYNGSYSLFGHEHGNLKPHGFSFDVGVDVWDYAPVSLERVFKSMKNLEKTE